MTPDPVEPVVEPAPVAAVEPPAAPAPTPPAADAPWSKDLAATFQDEVVRTQVDSFLRGHVQPHVTQVEQQYAPARKLWEDLQGDDSVETYVDAARQLYGDEVADVIESTLAAQLAEPDPPAGDPPPAAVLTPEQQANHEWIQAQRVESEYNSELARVKEAGVVLTSPQKEAWFANFVVGAEGNFDEAARRWEASGLANVPDAAPAPVVPAANPAPPTLGDGGGPVLPTEKKYASISDAVDDAMDDLRAAREAPAAVGQ
jgi:hypothetical protein